jgi:hypothetical protein
MHSKCKFKTIESHPGQAALAHQVRMGLMARMDRQVSEEILDAKIRNFFAAVAISPKVALAALVRAVETKAEGAACLVGATVAVLRERMDLVELSVALADLAGEAAMAGPAIPAHLARRGATGRAVQRMVQLSMASTGRLRV